MDARRFLVAALVTLIALTAGCARGPSGDDLRAAIQANVRSDLSKVDSLASTLGGNSAVHLLRALGSPDPKDVRVEHVTVLEQQRLDDGDYDMRVRYDLVTPNGSDTLTRDLLLEHRDDGHWRAVPHEQSDS
ncbi:hypothetical protein [Salinisphaera hydrothermalis]|uniref:hypothetical protein n=1 Tax=Salinisphaera hydrothermalis TaxID=563188 RepID=UPI0033401A06